MKHTISILFTVILFSVSIPLQAQLSTLDSSNAPKAIPITNLVGELELIKEQLKNVDRKTEIPASIVTIDSLLPLNLVFIEEQKKEYLNFKQSHPNKEKVINLVSKWKSYNNGLDNWQSIVNENLDKNNVLLGTLHEKEKEWALTYTNILTNNIPQEVQKNVRSTKSEIASFKKKAEDLNNFYLRLETKVLIQKEYINSIIAELEEWKVSSEFKLFYLRHPPVWDFKNENKFTNQESFNAAKSFEGNINGLIKYLKSPENNVKIYVVIIVLLFVWLLRLKNSFKTININDKDDRLIQSKNVIVNHQIASFVFTAVIISIVFFDNTPNLLSELFLIIALISCIPLLKDTTHPRFKGIIYIILFLYVLNTLKSYVWYSSMVYRLYLFLEAGLSIAFLIKLTFPFLKTRRLKLTKLSRILVTFVPVFYTLFLGSILSDIFGYTNLTDLLLKIGVQGAVLFVMLYGIKKVLSGLTLGSIHYYFSKLESINYKYKHFLETQTLRIVNAFAYFFLSMYFLHIIDIYDLLKTETLNFINEPISFGAITFTIANILGFILVLAISYIITSFISKVIDGGILNFMKLPKGMPRIISVIVRYFITAFAFIIALSSIGIDLSQFNLMAGALGLGIGFGLQGIISNFISGLILIFERPIQSGDVVEVGDLLGKVNNIGVRASNVRTFDGAEVVVPNSNIISNTVINWTLSDNVKRIEVNIGTAYGSDLQQVVDILKSAALAEENILNDPEPVALFDNFGDSSLDFRLLYWVPVEFGIISKSNVSIAIYNSFKKEGISIPFPQRDVNFKKEDLDAIKGIEDKPNA